MTEKAAPDYSASAENLCNPPQVFDLLEKLHEEQAHLEGQEELLRSKNEVLYKQIKTTENIVLKLQADLKQAIETYGSFQDKKLGLYAVKYRRITKSYNVVQFKHYFEKFIPAVVEEAINVEALEGLIKGGLLAEEDLKKKLVITETPHYAFYIR